MIYSVEYPKTENLFQRDPETHKLIPGALRSPHFGQVKSWHVTEKIDGQNVRIVYKPGEPISFRGRSDRAALPRDLVEYLEGIFNPAAMEGQFAEFLTREGRDGSVTIYGEGYGPGIQKGGGNYAPAKLFRMFDVMYHWHQTDDMGQEFYLNSWATMETVDMISDLSADLRAPVLGEAMTLQEIVALVAFGLESKVARYDGDRPDVVAEGVIARSDPYLYTARGSRVMFKLKGEDLA